MFLCLRRTILRTFLRAVLFDFAGAHGGTCSSSSWTRARSRRGRQSCPRPADKPPRFDDEYAIVMLTLREHGTASLDDHAAARRVDTGSLPGHKRSRKRADVQSLDAVAHE